MDATLFPGTSLYSDRKSAEETSLQTSSSKSFQMAHTFITKYGWLTSLQSVLLRVRSMHDLFCQSVSDSVSGGTEGIVAVKATLFSALPHTILFSKSGWVTPRLVYICKEHRSWKALLFSRSPEPRAARDGVCSQGLCLDRTPTLSRSPTLPRWRCHKHAKPFQPQQSQRNSNTAMKNQGVPFEPKPLLWKFPAPVFPLRSTCRWMYWKRFSYQVSCVNH